jgi:hypothetical protein
MHIVGQQLRKSMVHRVKHSDRTSKPRFGKHSYERKGHESLLSLLVHFTRSGKFGDLVSQAMFECLLFLDSLFSGVLACVFRYVHIASASTEASGFAEKLPPSIFTARPDDATSLRQGFGLASKTAGPGIARRKSHGVSGKPDDDDGFAALAQLESA